MAGEEGVALPPPSTAMPCHPAPCRLVRGGALPWQWRSPGLAAPPLAWPAPLQRQGVQARGGGEDGWSAPGAEPPLPRQMRQGQDVPSVGMRSREGCGIIGQGGCKI